MLSVKFLPILGSSLAGVSEFMSVKMDDIFEVFAAIVGQGYKPNTIIMHPDLYQQYKKATESLDVYKSPGSPHYMNPACASSSFKKEDEEWTEEQEKEYIKSFKDWQKKKDDPTANKKQLDKQLDGVIKAVLKDIGQNSPPIYMEPSFVTTPADKTASNPTPSHFMDKRTGTVPLPDIDHIHDIEWEQIERYSKWIDLQRYTSGVQSEFDFVWLELEGGGTGPEWFDDTHDVYTSIHDIKKPLVIPSAAALKPAVYVTDGKKKVFL